MYDPPMRVHLDPGFFSNYSCSHKKIGAEVILRPDAEIIKGKPVPGIIRKSGAVPQL